MAVGNGQHCTFKADKIGSAALREHFPIPDKSFIAATFFNIINKPPLLFSKKIIYVYITIKFIKKLNFYILIKKKQMY